MNWLFFLFEVLVFIVLVKWFILLPGLLLLNGLKARLKSDEKVIIALGLGIVFLTLSLFFFGTLKIKGATIVFLTAFNLWFIFQEKRSLYSKVKTYLEQLIKNFATEKVSLLLLILGTVITGSLIFNSGWETKGVLLFTEYRDAMWHLGLMKELVRSIPPLHPGFALEPLTNYHYFTHLFGSFFLNFSFFNDLDFYFRILPFFLMFFYGLNLYLVGKAILIKKESKWLLIILGYFASSLAYVLPLFIRYPNFSWHESSFWLSQPFSMVINPSFSLSASMVLLCIVLVKKVSLEVNSRLVLPLLFIAGSLIEFKVYAGLLVLGAGLFAGIWQLIRKKDKTLLLIFLGAFLISFLIFYPTSGKGAGNFLVFLPGWFLRSMVESPDRVQIIDWVLREETYWQYGNWFGVLRLRFYELLIYLAGNFGIRIVGLLGGLFLLVKIKKRGSTFIFVAAITLAGIIIPLLFVQNGSIANTLQFSYYSLILANFGVVLVWERFFNQKTKIWAISSFAILILLAIPTSVKVFEDTWSVKTFRVVSAQEREAINYLKEKTDPQSVILVPATYKHTLSMLTGTLSNRRFYYLDRLMSENTLKDFKDREAMANSFFNSQDKAKNKSFLKINKINYVYVEKEELPEFNEKNYPLKKIFANQLVAIYEVPWTKH